MNLIPTKTDRNRYEVQIEDYLTYVIMIWGNPFIKEGYEVDEFILVKNKDNKNTCFNSELSRFLSVPERFTSIIKALRLDGRI